MRLALGQFDATIGDLAASSAAIRDLASRASADGADLLILPELAILGYPPRDGLLRAEVVPACERAVAELARDLPLPTLVGSPRRVDGGARPIANSVALCRGGRIEAWHDKLLLPTYDVFDESRWFEPGREPLVFDIDTAGGSRRVGVLVCEDLWRAEDASVDRRYPIDPVAMLADAGCDLVASPSASPFVVGKHARHRTILAAAAARLGVPVAMANQIGAHDDLIFDGGSMVVRPDGSIAAALPRFEDGLSIVDLAATGSVTPQEATAPEERFHAIRRAIADYCRRTGHPGVVLGLSGGIDSALVVALAVAALGPDAVLGVLLPSRYSSEGSKIDARASAAALGIRAEEIAIEPLHAAFTEALDPMLRVDGEGLVGLADENVQARSRGVLLMAISNARRRLLLSTSNKSELAVGYSTLYGDMCGGLAPIGDLWKTEVFELARWMNEHHASLGFAAPPIPVSSIEKPPSAELRPDQRDDDSLPPYEILDAYLRARVDEERAPDEIAATVDVETATVAHLERLLAISEFKRYQATIIPKLAPRTFGRGREMPVGG
jgi:NAD+ synthase (glutamine-hydrolysing)